MILKINFNVYFIFVASFNKFLSRRCLLALCCCISNHIRAYRAGFIKLSIYFILNIFVEPSRFFIYKNLKYLLQSRF